VAHPRWPPTRARTRARDGQEGEGRVGSSSALACARKGSQKLRRQSIAAADFATVTGLPHQAQERNLGRLLHGGVIAPGQSPM
jgi:hypothetical protein